MLNFINCSRRAKLGQIQGGEGCRGPAKIGQCFTFYALKIELSRAFMRSDKKGLLLRILRYKKVPF